MRVAVDTNALMMPVECNVRLFDELDRLLGGRVAQPATDGSTGRQGATNESAGTQRDSDGYEAVTPAAVVDELETLAAGNGEEAVAASVGRDLADRCTVVSTDADYADDAIVELAADCDYAVTNDRPLRRRLSAANVPVICLRGGTKLAITD